MINSIILISAIVLTVIVAGLFSGAETGMYQLSRLRLRLGVEKKQLRFITLDKALQDGPALLLSILIVTNLAYYLATSIVTYMLFVSLQAEHAAEVLATLLTAPVLFVFSELLPKNIFFYRSDSLMPWVAPVVFAFHKLFSWCGIVALLRQISLIFAQLTGSPYLPKTAITATQQHQISALLQDSREEDFLSTVQTDIIKRLTSISNISIRSVMIPINKVQMVSVNSDKSSLLEILKESPYTRLPVYDRRPENIIGFINIYDCLGSSKQFTDLHNFIKPIRKFVADTTVLGAINTMQSESQKIVLVAKRGRRDRERPIGIVTMKDLVEELLGELTEW